MKSIVISSGHGLKIRGASGYLDEVDEARRVVNRVAELLVSAGLMVKVFHDNTSTNQSDNLEAIVDYHNSQSRDLDISVHFNAYETTSKPMGVEVLYVTQSELASELSAAMATTEGLPNRGGKYRSDLYFLNNTGEPAILIETCFVDSSADANAYRAKFEAVCTTIAEVVGEVSVAEPPPEGVATVTRPTIMEGDRGELVRQVQSCLRTDVDGLFGNQTESAVKEFQRSQSLSSDGIVGPNTWAELESEFSLPPYEPFIVLSKSEAESIASLAENSDIADYSWRDRGRAPLGYTQGMALSYAEAYRHFQADNDVFLALASAATDEDIDALAWYRDEFNALRMYNTGGAPTLRHLYVLMMGLGMRESSGKHCEGRDMSADNVTSTTAEAGLFQTSWNAREAEPSLMDELYNKYYGDSTIGYVDYFEEGVSCGASSWECYGDGQGEMFQYMCKTQPMFAVETCGVTLRYLRAHYGPINRKEAEIRPEADELFTAIEAILDG